MVKKNLKYLALTTTLIAAASCGKNGGGTGGDPCANIDPNASATQQDFTGSGTPTAANCCKFSINCQAGSICNDMTEDLYDSSKPAGACIKVICSADSDCTAPKTCSLEKVCNSPICQVDAECTGGTSCISGSCKAAPMASDVSTCQIVTRNQALKQGQTVTLDAVAINKNGVVLPHIGFDWTSSNTGAVSVAGGVATGGATAGSSMLSAKVTGGSATCMGSLTINNFPTLAAGMSRVILVEDDTGAAITGAQVTFQAGANTMMVASDMTGAALAAMGGSLDSVTITKTGRESMTVLQPGTNDVFLPVPKVTDKTRAGGFRGSVDISATKHADIQIGIAGPAIPFNLLDFALTSLLGDSVKTVIDAPELGLNMQNLNLPGGVLLGLGNKHFTADNMQTGGGVRCQGTAPTDAQLGCYLARAPSGEGAGWVMAGQLKLSQVTSIATQLSNAFGMGKSMSDVQIGDILTAVLPLLRTLDHGVAASINTQEFPKVASDAAMPADCTNASLDKYDDKCRGDYAKYTQVNLAANQSLGVFSTINVPTLPNLPKATGCAGAAILVSGAILPGRGILPLGLSAGLDVLKADTPDCKIDGVEKPFGDYGVAKLMDGQMALSMAPPHDGIEGSQLFLLLLSLDPKTITGSNIQLTALVKRGAKIDTSETFSDSYLGFPTGTLSKSAGTFVLGGAMTGATMTRLQIEQSGETWLVYAPSTMQTITVPNVTIPRGVLTNSDKSFVQGIKLTGSYSDTFTFGSGKTLDHFVDAVQAFVVQECSTTATGACVVQ